MKYIILYCLAFLLFMGCKKDHASKVDIYMLKSFTVNINQATIPATPLFSNAILADTPLVADKDIAFYTRSTSTFNLKKDIKPVIQNYGPDKAFAVTVNNEVVYFGSFHPAYLNSIAFGVATIDPVLFSSNELQIKFATMDGNTALQQLDKRNDTRITNSLKASGRLR